jgi:hypothetical protein
MMASYSSEIVRGGSLFPSSSAKLRVIFPQPLRYFSMEFFCKGDQLFCVLFVAAPA